jgi:phage terminase small subunit
MNAGEVNEDGQPLAQRTLTRLSRVCGLAAWQRVPLTLEKFKDLTEDEKNELFTNFIQQYIVYPEELKEKGKRAAMKGISHSWRGYKNRLVTCLRKKQNPFEKFKDLKEEDWERFVAKCESPEFVVNSEYMRQL